jgi:Fe-Mn family superoxide dismutase
MKLHHTKHHQTYVSGLNAAEEAYAAADSTSKKIALQSALKFNGGGHINHSLFWTNLSPSKAQGGKIVAGGQLEKAIVCDFGSVEEFKKAMNAKTAAIQGSGWGWLVRIFLSVAFVIAHSFRRDMIQQARNSKF